MDNDKIVYQEFYAMKNTLQQDRGYMTKLDNIHQYLIDLGSEYLCEVDCKFGENLIKIKRESWKTQCYGIANHHLYEKYSRVLFRQTGIIDYNFTETKNITGIDLFDVVFIVNRPVNYRLFNQLYNLAKKELVIPTELLRFDTATMKDKNVENNEKYQLTIFGK